MKGGQDDREEYKKAQAKTAFEAVVLLMLAISNLCLLLLSAKTIESPAFAAAARRRTFQ